MNETTRLIKWQRITIFSLGAALSCCLGILQLERIQTAPEREETKKQTLSRDSWKEDADRIYDNYVAVNQELKKYKQEYGTIQLNGYRHEK